MNLTSTSSITTSVTTSVTATSATPDHSAIIMLLAGLILTLTFISAICAILLRIFLRWRGYNHTYSLLRGTPKPTTQPALATVRPGWMFDASDLSAECPECYIEWLRFDPDMPRTEDGIYVMPAGAPVVCPRHSATTLARALLLKKETAQ